MNECEVCDNDATTTVLFTEPKHQAFVLCDHHAFEAIEAGAQVLTSAN